MQKIVIASNNKHKIEEIQSMLPKTIQLVSLSEIGCFDDIPEEADTLEGNAMQKADYVFKKFGLPCFADDTGLEVEALNGKPGVHSARYSIDVAPHIASEERSAANIVKLLDNLQGASNRNAAFRTVICYMSNIETLYFEGKVEGTIIPEMKGEGGFGYDPVFIPVGYEKTFAELPFETKNKISHRAKATEKLIQYLLKNNA